MAGNSTIVAKLNGSVNEGTEKEQVLKRHSLLLNGINRIFKEALTCDTEQELGKLCLSVAEEITGSAFGFIGELTAEGLQDIAISNAGWDACKGITSTGHRKAPGNFKIHGLYERVLKDGKSLFTNDPAAHPDSIGLPPGHPPLKCFLGVPLVHDGKTIGMIGVGNCEGGYARTQLEVLEFLAPTVVTALMSKRTEQALLKSELNLKMELDAARKLQQISTEMIQADDIKTIYEKIIDTATSISNADSASIQLFYPDRGSDGELRLIGYHGFSPQAAKFWQWVTPASQSPCGEALRTGQRVLVPDIQICDFMAGSEDQKMCLQTGIRAVQTTPLTSRSGAIIGFFSTHWREPHEMTPYELCAMDILARQAADFIDRKIAEGELRENEEHLASLFSVSSVGMAQTDPLTRRFERVNPALCHITGYSESELLEMTVDLLNHPDDRKLDRMQYELLMGDEADYRIEKRYLRKDGQTIWVLVSGSAVRDAEGRTVHVFAVVQDITELKQAEKALRESVEIYRSLFDENHSILMLIDPHDGRIVNANSKACNFYGYSLDQIKQLKITDINISSAKQVFAAMESIVSLHGMQLFFKHRLADGQIRDVEVFCGPVTIGGEELLYSIIHDITDRINAENALRQLNETLENQVMERTALAEFRAKQLQELAVELIETEERERRRFSHLLHDDLQQVLAAAKMQAQAVADTFSSEPMLENVVTLLEESISKSRRLSHELSPTILHQAGLVAALEWLSRQMDERFGLKVALELNTELLMERTPQKVFLFRAAQEMLFNIVKHAGVKSATVEVTSSEDSISVTVSDKGKGFDSEVLQKRASKAGFGLLTIKERASYIGGEFTIASVPGQGGRLTLKVPNAAAESDEEAPADAPVIEKSKPSRSKAIKSAASGTRVLFVDDHRVMRQGLIKLVNGQPGIQVVGEASNGCEAYEQTLRLRPDVIVMDVSMPEMDGIEATRRIKAELPQVRIIGLTMHEDEQLTNSMQQAGASLTLSKTVSATQLIKAIYEN